MNKYLEVFDNVHLDDFPFTNSLSSYFVFTMLFDGIICYEFEVDEGYELIYLEIDKKAKPKPFRKNEQLQSLMARVDLKSFAFALADGNGITRKIYCSEGFDEEQIHKLELH